MDKAEADAALTRLWRAEALTALAGDIDAAIGRRRDTRGEAFTMTVGGSRFGKRRDAGLRLRHLLQQQIGSSAGDGGRSSAPVRHGHLGGFDVTAVVQRVLGSTQVTVALDGAPEAEVRLAADEVRDADPVGLITRLENRLHGLEALQARTLVDIGRLRTEADRARDDLARSFPQARQLADARDKVKRIDEQLEEAAKPPRHDEQSQSAPAPGEHVNGQAPAHDRPGGQRPEPVKIAGRDFPEGNPVTGHRPSALPAASRPAQSSHPSARPVR